MKTKTILSDIKTLRKNARQHIEQGAVTESYTADRVANQILHPMG